MPYQIAGIHVHKKMLAVVVADVGIEGDDHFERLKVGTSPAQLRALADWLVEREVEEVVMESTAQYWRPVWEALEQYWRPVRRTRAGASPVSGTLHLAQAQSCRPWPTAKRIPRSWRRWKARGGASIPHSRSLRKSAPPPRRFLHRSISRRGWALALGARRVRARTTVIAAPRAIDRCGGSSIRPPTPP